MGGVESRRNKWNGVIRFGISLLEKVACKYSTVVVSDNKGIQEYLVNYRGVSSVIIAYGGDHVLTVDGKISEWPNSILSAMHSRYVVTICRIEPENNVEMLLEGFLHSKGEKYILIGNWKATPYGKKVYRRYAKEERLLLSNSIYDLSLLNELRSNCLAYLHGHSVGGTNPSLVEAMFFGRPIIAFDVSYNRYTTENLGLYFNSVDSLTILVNQVIAGIHNDVGNKLAELASNVYTWEKIARQYEDLMLDLI